MRFVAMNNFQVAAEQVAQFEERWQHRRSYLHGTPGFESFQLLRGESQDGGRALRVPFDVGVSS
jgi:heme-degrading monooxygenase HmoA